MGTRCALSRLTIGISVALIGLWSTSVRAADEVRFSQHVRPILSDRCFQCHGPDAATRAADLRLDDRAVATADRGGYAAIVPGDPDASELWRRISSPHAGTAMPPPGAGKKELSDRERDLLRRWIEQGATYEDHWSFAPPARPKAPDVNDPSWVRTEIDRFILARLDREGLAPSAEADRATLLRRLFLDVTGLPPTPTELDAFLSDSRPDAYERWVDRLFAEEPFRSRFAEHWSTIWLDAARYADTSGIHMDNGRQIWLWRDWVLQALRDNMPYDRFVIEQLAGDLIPDATVAQQIASGFNRNHITTDEGGAIAEEYLIEYAVDRASTTASVFLGLTVGCARCHDHKYDPISQEEFYEFMAFFNTNEEPGLYTQTADSRRAYEPFIEVPSEDELRTIAELEEQIAVLKATMDEIPPDEAAERASYVRSVVGDAGVRWSQPRVMSAASSEPKVELVVQEDGAIQAGGAMPAFEDYTIHLETDQQPLRLMLLEALATPDSGRPGAGRAGHGNAVVSYLTVEARPKGSDAEWQAVPMGWGWTDHHQTNGDFEPGNALRNDDDARGWALDGNANAGERFLLLLAENDFGFDAGTELRVRLEFRSKYAQHSLGRIRFRLGGISEAGLDALPPAFGRWYLVGHYAEKPGSDGYDKIYGPETATSIDTAQKFGARSPALNLNLADEKVVPLGGGTGTDFMIRWIDAPTAREMDISLGSDDGFQLFVNGEMVAEERVDRGAAADQSRVTISLREGRNMLALKVINTGGPAGYYFRDVQREGILARGLVTALIPEDAWNERQARELAATYRRLVSPVYREAEQELATTESSLTTVRGQVARTMVMKDRAEPRQTYVLVRGQYDHPDMERPVEPGVPSILGTLGERAPTRLGLAEWITDDENPLAARVAVNRLWLTVFGAGLVRTEEDFGLQGSWPEHPELLDWLAVELREQEWDLQHLIRLVVTSSTYRQSSRVRDDLRDIDPSNRLFGHYPRRRLTAEQIRDLALYTSGLLQENLGGPSVKPYQPDGLWREVAMPNSNTRNFQRGGEEDLWRRSLYTYWKRASPPPSLMTFDAPTREACVVRRPITNTPLQALVLWNDEQFVEAARVLAARLIREADDDEARLVNLFRICTARVPDDNDRATMLASLQHFRQRYDAAPDDARALVMIGAAPPAEGIDPSELAAWTVLSSAVLSLHETITQD